MITTDSKLTTVKGARRGKELRTSRPRQIPASRNREDNPIVRPLCLKNAHISERNLGINPNLQVEDPMMDRLLSDFACTMEWQRETGKA